MLPSIAAVIVATCDDEELLLLLDDVVVVMDPTWGRALAVAGMSGRLQKSEPGKGSDTPGCRDALSPESGETVWNPALSRRALPRIWGDSLEPYPIAISVDSFP